MAKHMVKCFYCSQSFDANIEPYEKVNSRRYAHAECHKKAMENRSQEEKDKEQLENYIKELFQISYIPEKIHQQLKRYLADKNYTYRGIYNALRYHYEVKKGSIEKANGGIGIVPFVYENACRYWYDLWETRERNKNTNTQAINIPVREVHILPPQREPMRRLRKQFTFLDEEE